MESFLFGYFDYVFLKHSVLEYVDHVLVFSVQVHWSVIAGIPDVEISVCFYQQLCELDVISLNTHV